MKLSSIKLKTLFVGFFIILLFFGFLYLSYGFVIHISDEAKRIDLAGSERMRSLDISYHLNKLSAMARREDREFHYSEIKSDIKDFEEILYALKDGSKKYEIPSISGALLDKEIQNSLNSVITRWNNELRPNIDNALQAFDRGNKSLARSYIKKYDSIVHPYIRNDINRLMGILKEDIKDDVKGYIVKILMFLGIVGFIIFVIYLYFIWTTVNPLLQLSAVTKSMAKGDFTIRSGYEGDNEIGELASSFNKMAETLENMSKKSV